MLRHIDHKKMGLGKHGWLQSYFHFTFAEYYNPENMQFGILRVLNDDIIQPKQGFATHPHNDMEIISYVVKGALSHRDSMGNESTIYRGQAQYMSAGTGITHSEYNLSDDELRFMQMWILPDKKGHTPNYGDRKFTWEERIDKWLPVATSYNNKENNAPIKIHADANVFATYLSAGKSVDFFVKANRQAYLVLLEGEAKVENIDLTERDALEIIGQNITVTTSKGGHLYMIEMAA